MSNEKSINQLISKKYVKYLFILLIVYFVYQNYNLVILSVIFLLFFLVNTNYKTNIKGKIVDYFNTLKEKVSEKFSNMDMDMDMNYDFKPFIEEEKSTNNSNSEKKIQPFKEEVLKIKEMYENIKLEINKLK
jgi:hypothetical protein